MFGLSSNEKKRIEKWLNDNASATFSSDFIGELVNTMDVLVKRKQKELIGADDTEIPFGEAFAEVWEEWLIFRRKHNMRKYKTNRPLKKLVTLSNNNEDIAIKILDQSMDNLWQGLFEINKNEQQTSEYNEIERRITERY